MEEEFIDSSAVYQYITLDVVGRDAVIYDSQCTLPIVLVSHGLMYTH